VTKDSIPIRPPTCRNRKATKRRDLHLVDQVAEKGGLGENFDIEERRYRLERHAFKLIETMEPTRRVDVAQWESEN
jgi:hypothetical protein